MQNLTPLSKGPDFPRRITFEKELLEKEEYFSRMVFSELIDKNFDQGHDYVVAFIEDEDATCTAHDGACVSRSMAKRIGGYSPETGRKIVNVWYYVWPHPNLSQPAKMTLLTSQKEIMTEPCISLVLANDWTLEEGERALYQFQVANYFYELNHQDPRAFLWFSRAAQNSQDTAIILNVAQRCEEQKDFRQALDLYKKAVAIDKTSQSKAFLIDFYERCEIPEAIALALELKAADS